MGGFDPLEGISAVLVDLGLTPKQAKFLLVLSKFEQATVKEISEVAQAYRQEVYQVFKELQEIGLIEKRLGTPNRYKATPVAEALNLLLARKNRWISEVQKKSEELMRSFPAEKENAKRDDLDITLITGIERFSHALYNWYEQALSIDLVLVYDRFSFQIGERLIPRKLKFKPNVKVRIITCAPPESLKSLGLKSFHPKNVEYRFVKFPIPVEIAIINGNRARFRNLFK